MFYNNQHNALVFTSVAILFDIRGGKTEQRKKKGIIQREL